MTNKSIRNITIGLIDGLVIPFALASGLSMVMQSSRTIVIACLTATLAGAITMALGGYMEGRKYEPGGKPLASAITIGIAYITGGLMAALPYYLTSSVIALKWSAAITLTALFIAGWLETSISGKPGWQGALRTTLGGAAAAAAAYWIAGFFK